MGKTRISNLTPPRAGLVLAGLIGLSSVAFSSGVYADTASTGQQRIGAKLQTNSVEISTTGNVNIDVIPASTGALAVGKSTVTVTTTASSGYQLYISALNTDDNGYASLYFDGLANSTSKLTGISAATTAAFSDANQWGYAVGGAPFSNKSDYETASTAGSTVDRSTINNLKWRGLNKNLDLINTAAASGTTDVYYGIYVDNTIMTGNYQNSVIYTAFAEGSNRLEIYPMLIKNGDQMTITAEYQSSELPVTDPSKISVALLDGETSVGTCDDINILNNASNDLLKFSCTVTTNPYFEIGKLYDVTTELRFDGREGYSTFHIDDAWGTVLTSGIAMQDVTPAMCAAATEGNIFHLIDSRDDKSYLVTKLADGNCWMTQNLALDSGTTEETRRTITPADSDVSENYTLPISTKVGFNNDAGQFMYNGTDNGASHIDNIPDNITNNTGAYYSWITATAGSGAGMSTQFSEAASSICPKGWKLPSSGDNDQPRQLWGLYKNAYASNFTDFNAVWQGTLAGRYDNGSLHVGNTYGLWWSRSAYGGNNAFYLYQGSSAANWHYYDSKRYGFSVRCILDPAKTMQSFSQSDADAMAEHETIALLDTRDNKSYLVTKMKDGNVWMTQNLALAGGKTITPENSDVAENYTMPTTTAFNDDNGQDAIIPSHKDAQVDATDNTGGYYTWATATAGTNPSSGDTNSSICPKGWKLPAINNFTSMYSSYNNTLSSFNSVWHGALVGDYNGGSLYGSGSYVSWWLRAADTSSDAYRAGQSSSTFGTNSYGKRFGYSVRCIFDPQN